MSTVRADPHAGAFRQDIEKFEGSQRPSTAILRGLSFARSPRPIAQTIDDAALPPFAGAGFSRSTAAPEPGIMAAIPWTLRMNSLSYSSSQ